MCSENSKSFEKKISVTILLAKKFQWYKMKEIQSKKNKDIQEELMVALIIL